MKTDLNTNGEGMGPDKKPYVHGRSERESERLSYQASRLGDLLHDGTNYPPGSNVLEAACGVGGQTVILARNSPGALFTSVDISPESLSLARAAVTSEGHSNVTFRQADVYDLPFGPGTFDHVFVCFLLEHLPDPLLALGKLKAVIRPGGTITVIEGDHGSALFYPDSADARAVIRCLVDLQQEMGGNALIGRELSRLMREAGFTDVRVSPRPVYADEGSAESQEAVKNIFIAMVEGVRNDALAHGLADEKTWEKGIRDLYRTAGPGGSFCYTFFKATGIRKG
ncbi:MAG: methyltransferase domain-containing protein [Methanoregulaceae archaeon]|nr:methyltransferase domain-containing protein [Methanoregulaceae archaeon]